MNLSSQFHISNVSKTFFVGTQTQHVLKNISHIFARGRSYAIIGASGVGKSTLLHILAGFEQPTRGVVLYNDADISEYSSDQKYVFLQTQIGVVFQFHYLINELTVSDNIALSGMIAQRKKDMRRVATLLKHVGLTRKRDAYPYTLSGGEQQRVAIARALYNSPAFMLADEPTGNLDEQHAQDIIDILLDRVADQGMGLILCSHDRAVYERVDEVYRMHNGALQHVR